MIGNYLRKVFKVYCGKLCFGNVCNAMRPVGLTDWNIFKRFPMQIVLSFIVINRLCHNQARTARALTAQAEKPINQTQKKANCFFVSKYFFLTT